MSFELPDDWPNDSPLGKKMELFQEDLLCPICQELFSNPHILKCGHSFCSLCIRRHLDSTMNRIQADVCPVCREKAEAYDLRKNVCLGKIIENYKLVCGDLYSLLTDKEVNKDTESSNSKRNRNKDSQGKSITQRVSQINCHGLSKDKIKKYIDDLTKESKVKLNTQGDKDVLERRLRELVHLINAQIGSDNPLTLDEAITQINRQESEKEKHPKRSFEDFTSKQDMAKIGASFQSLTQKALESKRRKTCSSNELDQTSNSSMNNITLNNDLGEFAWLMNLPPSIAETWSIALSSKIRKPYFFNKITKIGQYEIPKELLPYAPESEEIDQQNEIDNAEGSPMKNNLNSDMSQHPIEHEITDEKPVTNPNSPKEDSCVEDHKFEKLFTLSENCEGDEPERNEQHEFQIVDEPEILTLLDPPSPELNESTIEGVNLIDEVSILPDDENCWQCNVCTFINNEQSPVCQLCESKNPNYRKRVTRSTQSSSNAFSEIMQNKSKSKKPSSRR